MNQEARQFAINWLKEEGCLKKGDMVGIFVLELIETFLDQSHDGESLDEVPKLFYLLSKEIDELYEI